MKPPFAFVCATILLVILLSACNLPQGGDSGQVNGTVATTVASTLVALTQPASQPTIVSPDSPTAEQTANTQVPTFTMTMEPTNTQVPTGTTGPTVTSIPGMGSIAGAISGYPYGSVPSLAVVAFGQEPPYYYWYLITGPGNTYYSMDGYVTSGNYQVVAYDSSGHAGGCTSYVLVVANQTVNCDISNWGGGYRAKPSGVPSP
jgi:hypothetical protein